MKDNNTITLCFDDKKKGKSIRVTIKLPSTIASNTAEPYTPTRDPFQQNRFFETIKPIRSESKDMIPITISISLEG